jgi:membrane fusion protein, heavy metal efflux system
MKYIAILVTCFCLLDACTNKKVVPEAEEKAETTEIELPPNIVVLSAEQMQTIGIQTDTLQLKSLSSGLKVNGMLIVPNQNKAMITSLTNGVIRTLLIEPGNVVRKGQLIATIVNPDVARMQQELQTTNAQLQMAELEQRRQQELVEGNAAPLKNLQRVRTELATLRATRNALQQQLQIMGISPSAVSGGKIITTLAVTAPISGTITEITAQIGSNVDPSTPIAQIIDNAELHIDLFVYEKDLSKVKPGQTIHFTLTNNAGKEYDAEIYNIGAAFAEGTKTVPVHALVKGDKTGLIERMSVVATVSIDTVMRPAVPTEAIVTYQGQDYIFTTLESPAKDTIPLGKSEVTRGFQFKRVPVVKGVSDVGFTEITLLEELPTGTKFISKGAFFAMAKMTNVEE